MNVTWIYGLVDPRNRCLRYIGKADCPLHRLKEHIKSAHRGEQTRCYNWIRELLRMGLKPELHIIEDVPTASWQYWEQFYIAQYKHTRCSLTNITNGGDGAVADAYSEEALRKMGAARKGCKLSEETRRKMSAAHKGLPVSEEARRKIGAASKGHTLTEEASRKIGEANKHRTITEETRCKIGAASRGRKHSEETCNKISASLIEYHARKKEKDAQQKW